MNSGSAEFVRSFLLVSALLIVWNVALNVAVDPHGVYGGFPAELFRDIQIEAGTRVSKAELARRFEGDTAIVGSSRVEVGYDPNSPAIPGGPACNLGISGTNFLELSHVLDFILRQPQFRRIVLCLDFQQFTEGRTVNYDFELSRFNPDLSLFDYHCNLLLRNDVTRASLKMLKLYFRGGHGEVTPLGFRRPEAMETDKGVARLANKKLRDALQDRGTLAGYRYSGDRLAAFDRFIRQCRSTNRELIVVIHPVHATMLESLHCASLWAEYESWIADVVRIAADASDGQTPVWDFTGYGPYASEPLLTSRHANPRSSLWFWEPSHCKAELGEQILRRIFNQPNADLQFGRRLTTEALPAHFAQIHRERDAWLQSQMGEAECVKQLARDAGHAIPIAVATAAGGNSNR
jgi:hypothetical protein